MSWPAPEIAGITSGYLPDCGARPLVICHATGSTDYPTNEATTLTGVLSTKGHFLPDTTALEIGWVWVSKKREVWPTIHTVRLRQGATLLVMNEGRCARGRGTLAPTSSLTCPRWEGDGLF
ncbi:unnamed protein product [Nezara viridula]|uniref:Uncharacterized protein n=1 Tax=Nezara viridula TaxID=85310 RepID=A0A9P0HL76_NEZVI|nr:unnamed protein product [Nezara viridula]